MTVVLRLYDIIASILINYINHIVKNHHRTYRHSINVTLAIKFDARMSVIWFALAEDKFEPMGLNHYAEPNKNKRGHK